MPIPKVESFPLAGGNFPPQAESGRRVLRVGSMEASSVDPTLRRPTSQGTTSVAGSVTSTRPLSVKVTSETSMLTADSPPGTTPG